MNFMRWVCLALLAALPSFAVHGEPPASITLWCQGTSTIPDDVQPDPITGGEIIVDLQERTVNFNSFRVPIERADGKSVLFHGDQTTSYEGLRLTVDGSINLVTGGVRLTFAQAGNQMTWKRTCRPLGVF